MPSRHVVDLTSAGISSPSHWMAIGSGPRHPHTCIVQQQCGRLYYRDISLVRCTKFALSAYHSDPAPARNAQVRYLARERTNSPFSGADRGLDVLISPFCRIFPEPRGSVDRGVGICVQESSEMYRLFKKHRRTILVWKNGPLPRRIASRQEGTIRIIGKGTPCEHGTHCLRKDRYAGMSQACILVHGTTRGGSLQEAEAAERGSDGVQPRKKEGMLTVRLDVDSLPAHRSVWSTQNPARSNCKTAVVTVSYDLFLR